MSAPFFRNAAFLLAIEILVKAKGLIALPLLTKFIGPEQFGVWSQTAVLAATLSPLIVLSTDSAVIRYLPGLSLEVQKRFFAAWFVFVAGFAGAVALVLASVPGPVAPLFFGAGDFASFVTLAAAMLVTTLTLNALRTWFRLRNETRVFGTVTAIQAAASLGALALAIFQGTQLQTLILYVVLADAVVAVGCALVIFRRAGFSAPDFSLLPKLLRFGLPLVPAAFANWGLGYMDRLFLVRFGTLEEIGIYAVTYQIGYIAVQLLVNPIWTMYGSTAAEAHNQERAAEVQRLFDHSVAVILVLSLPAIVGMAILGRDLLAILASPEFFSGAPLISIIALGFLFLMVSAYYEVSLGLAHRQHLAAIGAGLAFAVNLVLNILLIPSFTVLGAAVATMLGFATQLGFAILMCERHRLIRSQWNFALKVLLAALAMGVPVWLADRWLGPGLAVFPLKVAIGVVVFFLLIRAAGIVPGGWVGILARSLRHG